MSGASAHGCVVEDGRCLTAAHDHVYVTAEPECNGICMTAAELGVPVAGIAYAHPDCEKHGSTTAPPAREARA